MHHVLYTRGISFFIYAHKCIYTTLVNHVCQQFIESAHEYATRSENAQHIKQKLL